MKQTSSGRLPWAVCTLGEGKTDASRQSFFFGIFSQGIAAPTRHGQGLLPLRQQVTGDMPLGAAGRGSPGPQAAATPVAGATNVAPRLVGSPGLSHN